MIKNSHRSTMVAAAMLMIVTAARAQQFGPWSSPVNGGASLNTVCNDQHPNLSKDGLTVVFSSNRSPNPANPCVPALHLWVSQRDSLDSPWQAAQPLTMLNSPYEGLFEDHAANFSTDGHWLFFHSQRPSNCVPAGGVRQLWVAHRKDKRNDFGWEPPINLGCILNGPTDDAGPNIFEDGSGTLVLYFARNLNPPHLDPSGNGYDVYVSTCSADLASCNQQQLWGWATYDPTLNSPGRDTRTTIRRRDGLEMIITSNRQTSVGALDMWVSTRASTQDLWSLPINLNQDNLAKGSTVTLNTAANDGAPTLSWDGQELMFYSNRDGGFGFTDIYVSRREKLTSNGN